MSKVKKVFIDLDDDTLMEVFCTEYDTIVVSIEGNNCSSIELDVSTAIAFSKQLRTVINLAKEVS